MERAVREKIPRPEPFSRYLLLDRIALGGMAEVFQAKSFGIEGFERIVAIKRILPTLAEDEEFIKMFVDEARIASYLTHQNIVQIYELGRDEGLYYIAMEYVAGRDLRMILDRFKDAKRTMNAPMASFIVSRICEALDYAHRKRDPAGRDLKIIHRDVSPQNIIISFEGEAKLCDFGIAKAVTQSTRTQVGVLKGKFAYMSPEQVRGRPIDHRADLFALGVIFFEMLTGERLFLGDTDYSTLEAVRAAEVPKPRSLNPEIPPELERIVLKLLAKEPERRYQWASEVFEDIHDFAEKSGKLYHARHLRQFMQETYARDIRAENARLEAFISEREPEPTATDELYDPGPASVLLELGHLEEATGEDFPLALDPEENEEQLPTRSEEYEEEDLDEIEKIDEPTVASAELKADTHPFPLPPDRVDLLTQALDESLGTPVEQSQVLNEMAEIDPVLAETQAIDETLAFESPPAPVLAPTQTLPEKPLFSLDGTSPAEEPPPPLPPENVQPISPSPLPAFWNQKFALTLGSTLALFFVLGLFFWFAQSGSSPQSASIVIETQPATEVRVYFNGVLIGERTPVIKTDLAMGEHHVDLIAPGFRGYHQTFTISENRPYTLTIPLSIVKETDRE